MSNDFYNHDDGYPAFGAQGASSAMRAQLDKIAAGFEKCPPLAGNGSEIVRIKADASGLESVPTIGSGDVVLGSGFTGTGAIVLNADPTFSLTDLTTNNASTSQHGWMKKYPGDISKFLRGDGEFAIPAFQTATQYVERTSNTVLTSTNNSNFIDITSGTFTQTFDSMANLADGWFVWIRNSGSGDITIPASDGRTNWIMYSGEARLFMKDQINATLKSAWVTPFNKTFTASANFIKPPGYSFFEGLIWNGGSGGRKDGTGGANINGSGGGGCFPFKIPASVMAISTVLTVGAGGLGATTTPASGALGGASSIGAHIVMKQSANSEQGSSITDQYSESQGGSVGFEGGLINTFNSTIFRIVWGGGAGAHSGSSNAKECIYGGAGSGGVDSSGNVRSPGSSVYGGQGGAAGDAVSGSDGAAPGGAGGATRTGTKGGDGARGEIRIMGVA